MSFIRLNITAEGQTEERFVKDTLARYLGDFNISTDVRRVLTSKDKRKAYRGGLLSYQKARKDILTWLKEDNNEEVRFTTMFDLYALPNDFPNFQEAQKINDPYDKIEYLEKSMMQDIKDHRFIPYIQLHEFEALILSNPRNLEIEYLENEKAIQKLEELLEKNKGNSELINEGGCSPKCRFSYLDVNLSQKRKKMTESEFIKIAKQKYQELRELKDEKSFYEYEKKFDELWVEFGRQTLEKSISKTTKDRRKKKS